MEIKYQLNGTVQCIRTGLMKQQQPQYKNEK